MSAPAPLPAGPADGGLDTMMVILRPCSSGPSKSTAFCRALLLPNSTYPKPYKQKHLEQTVITFFSGPALQSALAL